MKAMRRLRWVGLLEGTSFLVLLGVAMPLKYLWGMPMAVRVIGMLHGLLFTAYVFMAFQAVADGWLTKKQGLRLAIASVLPFGPFIADRELHRLAQAKPDDGNTST